MSEKDTAPVTTPDVQKAFLDAMSRARSVPPSATLFDRLSPEQWEEDGKDWNVVAGSDDHDADELDAVDFEESDAA